MNQYTSLKLSKLLIENGFENENEYYWICISKNEYRLEIYNEEHSNFNPENEIRAFDILNDLCVKYAKEIFGKEYNFFECKDLASSENYVPDRLKCDGLIKEWNYTFHTRKILNLFQQNKKDEAEKYLWENCLYNPKNKL